MTREDLYEMWAPARSAWSAWAKPVLFAAYDAAAEAAAAEQAKRIAAMVDPVGALGLQAKLDAAQAPPQEASWAPDPASRTAVVVDLAGVDAVAMGIALARRGYRPVPVFNGNIGPSALIEMTSVRDAIASAAAELLNLGLVDEAAPAFLVDARRQGKGLSASPGRFDNRWLVFPQDFPSGNLLRSRGFQHAIVCQSGTSIAEDLQHVLLRWQEAGVAIALCDVAGSGVAGITVAKPPRFRSFLYRLLAIMGLRRNSAGGFGSSIPMPSSGGSGGYRGGFS